MTYLLTNQSNVIEVILVSLLVTVKFFIPYFGISIFDFD